MEGALNFSKIISVLSQQEKLCIAEHGPVVKMRMCQQLCANEMQLVDLDAWGLKPRAPIKSVTSRTFTRIGKNALNRAKLGFERRFMNSTNEKIFQELQCENV